MVSSCSPGPSRPRNDTQAMSFPGRQLRPAERAGAAAGPVQGPKHPVGQGAPRTRRGYEGRQPSQDGLHLTGSGREGESSASPKKGRSKRLSLPSAASPNRRPGPSAVHRRHPALSPLRTTPATRAQKPRACRRSHSGDNHPPSCTPRSRSQLTPTARSKMAAKGRAAPLPSGIRARKDPPRAAASTA